jgi:ribosome biogenesis GTPase
MDLKDLGYNQEHEHARKELNLENFGIGRVVAEHRERYVVRTETGETEAEITGNMRFTAESREDFPAVGDWVALTAYDTGFAVIHTILPRFSLIKRQAVGQIGEVQVIAVNIDFAFITQAVDRDFNINRLERYLAICHSANVSPIILLTKTDLIQEARLSELSGQIKSRIHDVPVIPISNENRSGYDNIREIIEKGKTYCMLGSSGVGKSTLINNLADRTVMRTGEISESTNKGKHVTSHRELVILDEGGILIDNPGMREVGLTDSGAGLDVAFDGFSELAKSCRFNDCTHTEEAGCAVIAAIDRGELNKEAYLNYLKMEREKEHFESTLAERRKKEKAFGKILKNYKKDQRKNDP